MPLSNPPRLDINMKPDDLEVFPQEKIVMLVAECLKQCQDQTDEEFNKMLQSRYIKVLLAYLIANHTSDEKTVARLNEFVQAHGKECLHYFKEEISFTINSNTLESRILCYAVLNGYELLATQLLNNGFAVDEGTVCHANPIFHNISPLLIACEKNYINIVKILLHHGANLLHTNYEGWSTLMKAPSYEMTGLLLSEAESRNQLQQLISLKTVGENLEVFSLACLNNQSSKLNKLLENQYLQFTDITDLLHQARYASWNHPDHYKEFEAVCQFLRTKRTQTYRSLPFGSERPFTSYHTDYYNLFGKFSGNVTQLHASKNEKLELAISQAYNLLSSPQRCTPYLKFLNTELIRYFNETHHVDFPKINTDCFEFKILDGTDYPFPKDIHYVGMKKESALPNFLISYFKKYGLAQSSVKWIGFVPHEDADAAVKIGTHFTEDVIGSGLLHGKLSHAIQLFIILCAMEKGEITTVNINDFSKMLVRKAVHNNKASLWSALRDHREFNYLSFADPHRLNSIIMRDGEELGFGVLSHYLIDSFCKGFIRMHDALIKNSAFSEMSLADLYEKLNDYKSQTFTTPPAVLNHSINREKLKSRKILKESARYAIIEKCYTPNSQFKVRLFGEPNKPNESKNLNLLNQEIAENNQFTNSV